MSLRWYWLEPIQYWAAWSSSLKRVFCLRETLPTLSVPVELSPRRAAVDHEEGACRIALPENALRLLRSHIALVHLEQGHLPAIMTICMAVDAATKENAGLQIEHTATAAP